MTPRARIRLARAFAAGLALAPLAAEATSVWATWVVDGPTAATASTPDGRTAAYTGHPLDVTAAGTAYTASPALPGASGGTNPDILGVATGQPHPTTIDPGDLILTIDLANFGVDADTSFSLADMIESASYRIELLDASLAPLSLSSVQLTNFNLTYLSAALIADEDITLDAATGALRVSTIHDGGGTYRHSGVALLTNLPLTTRYIRLLSDAASPQASEGIQIYLGGSAVPEAATAGLLLVAGLLALRRRAPR